MSGGPSVVGRPGCGSPRIRAGRRDGERVDLACHESRRTLQRELLFLHGLSGVLHLDAEHPDFSSSGRGLHVLIIPGEGQALDTIGDELPDDRGAPLGRGDGARLSARDRGVDDGVLGGDVPPGDLRGVGVVAVVVRSPLALGSLPGLVLLVVGGERALVVVPVGDVRVVSALAQVAAAARQVVVGDVGAYWCVEENSPLVSTADSVFISGSADLRHAGGNDPCIAPVDFEAVGGGIAVLPYSTRGATISGASPPSRRLAPCPSGPLCSGAGHPPYAAAPAGAVLAGVAAGWSPGASAGRDLAVGDVRAARIVARVRAARLRRL